MTLRATLLAALLTLVSWTGALGHALDPAFLSIRQTGETSWEVFWRIPDVAGRPMAIGATLPGGCAPATGPEPRFDGAAWITRWVTRCPEGFAGQEIGIEGLSAQRADALVRIEALDQTVATTRLTPDSPSFAVPATPSRWDVFTSYLLLGFEHILEGLDHLLFVFALLVLIRSFWRLVGAITAFTVAHSITLGLATLGHITVPGPPVETVIALSIVFLAIEILKSGPDAERLSERAPWVVAFLFGLLHGLGFAGALSDIGLPRQDLATALLAFNLGVEAGQLAFVIAIAGLAALLRRALPALRTLWAGPHAPGRVAIGYAVGSIATFWTVERIMGF